MKLNLMVLCAACSTFIYQGCFGDDLMTYRSLDSLTSQRQAEKQQMQNKKPIYQEIEDKLNAGKEQPQISKEEYQKLLARVHKYKKQVKSLKEEKTKYLDQLNTVSDTCSRLQSQVINLEDKLGIYKEDSERREKRKQIKEKWLDDAEVGDYEGISQLVDKVSNVNIRDADANTALIFAVENNSENMVKLLLAQDQIEVNVSNIKGRTPLSAAVTKGNKNIVNMLLKAGADVTEGVLRIAIDLENKEIAELLLTHYYLKRREILKNLLKLAKDDDNTVMVKLLDTVIKSPDKMQAMCTIL